MGQKNFGIVTDPDRLSAFVDRLLQDGAPVGFDIETGYDGPDRPGAALLPDYPWSKIAGISFTNSVNWARYVPLTHDLSPNMDQQVAARCFWRLLSSGLGVAHNAKFELRHMARWFREQLSLDPEYGAAVQASKGYFPVLSDSAIEAYATGDYATVGLKALTKEIFGYDQATLDSLFPGVGKGKMKSVRFNVLELTPAVVSYACDDSVQALGLHQHHYPKVKDTLIYKVEMAVLPILCGMEDTGVRYDWSAMSVAAKQAEALLAGMDAEIQADLAAITGKPIKINLGSPAQIGQVLFEEMGLPPTRRTPTGKPSTDATAMTTLAKKYPVVQRILEWKEVKTLLTRYLTKYEADYAYSPDGMTHPNHMQFVVGTGRFAVSDPPYQQTPKTYHYELNSGLTFDLNFRDLIVAPPGHYILGFDYSQVELRMLAGESGEPSLLKAFDTGEDVHTTTAALMLGVAREAVTKENRAIGKTMNFALLYGMSAKSLAQRLGIDKAEGQRLYDQYFSAFSSISVWMDRVTREGKARGYATTKFGRRFTIQELKSDIDWIYAKGERMCVNAPIQGAAADYMKIAMTRAHKALDKAGLLDRVHMVMNIHDALEFYVENSLAPEEVIRVLQPAVVFPVPGLPKIVADWHVGSKWGSLQELHLDAEGRVIEAVSFQDDDSPVLDDDGEVVLSLDPATIKAAIVPAQPRQGPDVGASAPVPPPTDLPGPASPPGPVRESPSQVAPDMILTLTEMPTEADYQRFLDFLATRQDPQWGGTLVLATPEGSLTYDERYVLALADGPAISLILSGAVLRVDAASVDPASLTVGITL